MFDRKVYILFIKKIKKKVYATVLCLILYLMRVIFILFNYRTLKLKQNTKMIGL